MADQPEENAKSKGIIGKLTDFWNNLSNSIKALSTVLAAVLVIFTQFDQIKQRLFPSVPQETLDKIGYLDTLDANEIKNVFNVCAKYDDQCLNTLLNECEKLRSNNLGQQDAILWIVKTNEKVGDNEVYNTCMIKAKKYINNDIDIISDNESIVNGIDFYIELFDKFKPDHPEEVLVFFNSIKTKINDLSELEPLEKLVLINKIDKES